MGPTPRRSRGGRWRASRGRGQGDPACPSVFRCRLPGLRFPCPPTPSACPSPPSITPSFRLPSVCQAGGPGPMSPVLLSPPPAVRPSSPSAVPRSACPCPGPSPSARRPELPPRTAKRLEPPRRGARGPQPGGATLVRQPAPRFPEPGGAPRAPDRQHQRLRGLSWRRPGTRAPHPSMFLVPARFGNHI